MYDELRRLVGNNETILYEGKPNKACFIFESIFNPLLPFALLWGILDFGIIGTTLFASQQEDLQEMAFFLIPFFAIHLMPVWLYLGGVLVSFRKYRNTNYMITDKAIYITNGVFSRHFNQKSFAEMSHIDLRRGIFDQMFNVGDIICSTAHSGSKKDQSISINSISGYLEVYNLVKKLQMDMYSDIMYPNDLRPLENHGYSTRYKG